MAEEVQCSDLRQKCTERLRIAENGSEQRRRRKDSICKGFASLRMDRQGNRNEEQSKEQLRN